MACGTNLIRQPSLKSFPIWIYLISEPASYKAVQFELSIHNLCELVGETFSASYCWIIGNLVCHLPRVHYCQLQSLLLKSL
jgi:hypothetical protein